MNFEDRIPDMKKSSLCIACKAKCCTKLGIPTAFSASDDRAAEFYRARGNKTYTKAGKLWLLQDNPCPHLQKDFTCGVYQNRPQACRDYSCLEDTDVLGPTAWSEYLKDEGL